MLIPLQWCKFLIYEDDIHIKERNVASPIEVINMKVIYTEMDGKEVEISFKTEEEGEALRKRLRAMGVKNAKWIW